MSISAVGSDFLASFFSFFAGAASAAGVASAAGSSSAAASLVAVSPG